MVTCQKLLQEAKVRHVVSLRKELTHEIEISTWNPYVKQEPPTHVHPQPPNRLLAIPKTAQSIISDHSSENEIPNQEESKGVRFGCVTAVGLFSRVAISQGSRLLHVTLTHFYK
uniref:Uncharacterized protein n=1 Tax=Setaria digitata TaxID=48799 RepID=A0A915PZA5_9BILA